jgi:hypothetical protein
LYRLGDILEALLAEMVEAQLEFVGDFQPDFARDEDAAWLRNCLQPCAAILTPSP